MSDQKTVSTEVGTRLLFENDRVRVWDLRLEPGAGSGLHRHTTDFLYVVIGDGQLQRIDQDGTRHPVKPMADGDVVFKCIDGEEVHEAFNAGETPWRNIVVELKNT